MKSKKICLIIIIICSLIVFIGCTYLILNHKPRSIPDNEKFKELFELYNNVTLDDKTKLIELSIDSDNVIDIKSAGEIIDVLNHETALIYFGYPQSQSDRRMINILLDTAKEKNISKIYFVDIFNIRDEYTSINNAMPKETKKGTEAYKKIVEFLDEYLKNYIVFGGTIFFDTGLKRLNAPTIVCVSKGKIIDFHEGLVEEYADYSKPLTEKQEDKLKKVYENIYDSYLAIPQFCDALDESAC